MPTRTPPRRIRSRGQTRPPLYYEREGLDRLERLVTTAAGAPAVVGNVAIVIAPGLLQGLAGEIIGVSEGGVRLRLFQGGELTVSSVDLAVIAAAPEPG